ncbi:hypothetical protein AHAS_Ahas19G0200100 [Arachis hypogaea]
MFSSMFVSKYSSSSSAPTTPFPLASLLNLRKVLSGSESKEVEAQFLLPVIQPTRQKARKKMNEEITLVKVDVSLGVLRLFLQVACSSFSQPWRATPSNSSGTPKWISCVGMPRLRAQVARPLPFSLLFASGNLYWRATPKRATPKGWRATPMILSWFQWLACHASVFKWHAIVKCQGWHATPSIPSGTTSLCFWSFVHWRATPGCSSGTPSLQLPSAPSLDCCTSVPHYAAQVACPWICELFKIGVPRLGSQVARP